jgi:hypothetical protein
MKRALATLGALGLTLFGTISTASAHSDAHVDEPAWDDPAAWEIQFDLGPFTIAPVALIQVQAVPWAGDDALLQGGDVAERAGFRLRRARLGFEGNVLDIVPFEVSTELNVGTESSAALLDAWIGYTHLDYVQLFAGARKVPFSHSAMTGAGESALIERPFAVNAMAPYRQVGATVEGHIFDRAFNYYLGVYNGFQREETFFAGYRDNGAALGNIFDELAYAARLSTEPLGPIGKSIADLDRGALRLAAGGSFFFSDGGARDAMSAGGDLVLQVAGFHLLGEFLWSETSPEKEPTQETTQITDIESMGAVAEAGYVLPWNIGITARFEWIDSNTAIDDEGDQWAVTAGVGYHFVDNVLRAQLDYTHREELHGQSLDNDTVNIQLQLNL